MSETVVIARLRRDGGTQSRAEMDESAIEDYREAIEAGASFPPIVVFYDGEETWLVDGFHRVEAYLRAGKEIVAADVRQGSLREAVLFSTGVNGSHGLRRKNADKRRAVLVHLEDEEWSKRADAWIAEHCKVSQPFVSKVRHETQPITVIGSSPLAREGRDGKKRKAPKQPTPKPPAAPVHAPEPEPPAAEPESGEHLIDGDEDEAEGEHPIDDDGDDGEDEFDAIFEAQRVYRMIDDVVSKWPEDDPAYRLESVLVTWIKNLEKRRKGAA